MRLRSTAPVVLSALALVAAGCGEDEPEPTAAGTDTATTETQPTTPAETAPAEAAPSEAEAGGAAAGGGQISTDLDTKPEIPKPTGERPTELQVNDVVEGKGPAAKAGDTVQVRYVGVFFDTGEEFDASWNGGKQTFDFPLGAGMVIPGWDQGVEGMRVGGRRELVIPAELAYGDSPPPGFPADADLVFVVDLVGIA